MSRYWYVARRFAWMVFTAWIVLSMSFALFAYTPDPNEALIRFTAGFGAENPDEAQEEAISAYRSARNYDEPVVDRYVKWMTAYATFDWGRTFRGDPVVDRVERGLTVTLTYLLPALVLATIGALLVGLLAASRHGGVLDRLGSTFGYAGYGLPVFFLGEMAFAFLVNDMGMVYLAGDNRFALYSSENAVRFVLPGIIMTLNLLAVQLIYVRQETLEHMHAEFAKTIRANGGGMRAIARHALRNAAVPLVSVFFARVLTVLYLTVIVVEVVFGLPGFGAITFEAIERRDIGLILGTTFVPLFVGVVGNFVQDVVYTVLDPRVGYD